MGIIKKDEQGRPINPDVEQELFNEDLNEYSNKKEDYFDETFDDFETGIKNQADVVKLWLDTEPYLNNIYLAITNQQLKRSKYIQSGRTFYKTEPVPISPNLKPLANDLGIAQIMAELKIFLSSPLVQGNLTTDRYNMFMLWYCEKTTTLLWGNRLKWGITEQDTLSIYNKIVGSVSLFLTRPIGNLERGRANWNPNARPQQQAEGLLDKLAFWKKKRNEDTGG